MLLVVRCPKALHTLLWEPMLRATKLLTARCVLLTVLCLASGCSPDATDLADHDTRQQPINGQRPSNATANSLANPLLLSSTPVLPGQVANTVGPRTQTLSRPNYTAAFQEQTLNPDQILEEAIGQLFHGPALEAELELQLLSPDSSTERKWQGKFQSLGQGTGLARIGLPMDDDSNWLWMICRNRTCILTVPQQDELDREVFIQPDWLSRTSGAVQARQDCYGSPISLLQWARGQFRIEIVEHLAGQQLVLRGTLRPNIAQGWGDGTKLSQKLLESEMAPPQWLANHVAYPLPHQVTFVFSDQPGTMRTLLKMEMHRYGQVTTEQTQSVEQTLLTRGQWRRWKLAPDLVPEDFPLQMDADRTAGPQPAVRPSVTR